MNRAVVARLHNPRLTLQEALIIGGYRFPTSATTSFPSVAAQASIPTSPVNNNILHHTVMDDENVTIGQRKKSIKSSFTFRTTTNFIIQYNNNNQNHDNTQS
jgi:hypothetical protein